MTAENPILGRPWCVLLLDHTSYRVQVLEHARKLEDAEATAEEVVRAIGGSVTTLIVPSHNLTRRIAEWRQEFAGLMEVWYALE